MFGRFRAVDIRLHCKRKSYHRKYVFRFLSVQFDCYVEVLIYVAELFDPTDGRALNKLFEFANFERGSKFAAELVNSSDLLASLAVRFACYI